MHDPTSTPQPSVGDPRGLDRLDRLGIPEGSIDSSDLGSLRARSIDRLDRKSIGDPLGLDRSIDRLDRKSIGDPLGLDRIDSTRLEKSIGDPLGLDRSLDSIESRSEIP